MNIKHLSFLVIPIWPWGQVNVKWDKSTMFSERYGYVPTFCIFGIRFTWRRWREYL